MKIALTPDQVRFNIKCLVYMASIVESKVGGCDKGGSPILHRLCADATNQRINEIIEKLKLAVGEA